jgi:hypothetical protein
MNWNFFNTLLLHVSQGITESFRYVLYYPLQTLYLNGPNFGHFGFWNGKSNSDICSQLTNVPSFSWESSYVLQNECSVLIKKNFNSFYITIIFIVYFYIMLNVYNYYWYRYFYWKPFLKDLQFYVLKKKKLKK